jgi:membrane protein
MPFNPFLRFGEFSMPLLDSVRVALKNARQLGRFFLRDYRAAACQENAAALTYMTLFALVPFMAVSYAVFSMVPEFDGMAIKVQKFFFAQFVPESSAVLQSYFASFSKQAQKLTLLGALFLAVTAFLMLGNIERTFNKIWGVERGRKGLSKLLLYWAVLSIGPLLIGAAFAVSTYLLSLKFVVQSYQSLGLERDIIAVFPFILNACAFSFLFIAVPNCRVPLPWGFLGGVGTAVGFEALKWLFSNIVASSNFKFIYGAFAVLPLFLLWVNLLWMMVLGGAVLVRILTEKRYLSGRDWVGDMPASLLALGLFYQQQRSGGAVSDREVIGLGIDHLHWQRLRQKLLQSRWLVATQQGGYVLQRDLGGLCLWDLALVINPCLQDLLDSNPEFPSNLAVYQDLLNSSRAAWSQQWQAPLAEYLPATGASEPAA